MTADGAPRGRVTLDGLVKRFGTVTAVGGVSVDIPSGTFFSLLGPSGCGKSTLLRMIAGLEEPSEGRILIDGVDRTRDPARRRPTAMVFQSYALFPSMTVAQNVAYGLAVRRIPKAERADRVRVALRRVGLTGLDDRNVTQLSGGQQQRVAVARALAVEPCVMLYDEPLSNLDVALRERTRTQLRALQQDLGTTSIYVTHDQQEALAVSDRIAVMREGTFVQVGSPEQLYREPETAYVARFLGGANIIDDPGVAARLASKPGRDGAVLAVRPEAIRVDNDEGVEGRLVSRQFLGTIAEWILDTPAGEIRAWVPPEVEASESVRWTAASYRWVDNDESNNEHAVTE